jgi:hypothetical protein
MTIPNSINTSQKILKNEFLQPQFDETKFNAFTSNCKDARREIVALFIEQTPLLLLELDQSMNANLIRQTSKIIHKLKSSISILCTDAFYRDLVEFEKGAVALPAPEYISSGRKMMLRTRKLIAELQKIYA